MNEKFPKGVTPESEETSQTEQSEHEEQNLQETNQANQQHMEYPKLPQGLTLESYMNSAIGRWQVTKLEQAIESGDLKKIYEEMTRTGGLRDLENMYGDIEGLFGGWRNLRDKKEKTPFDDQVMEAYKHLNDVIKQLREVQKSLRLAEEPKDEIIQKTKDFIPYAENFFDELEELLPKHIRKGYIDERMAKIKSKEIKGEMTPELTLYEKNLEAAQKRLE